MTAQNPAILFQGSSHPGEDLRRWIGAHSASPGIVGFGELKVTEKSGTPNMSVDVAGGRCYIDGSEATYQGSYFAENRGNTNLVISASDGTNPRKDLIVAKVQDSNYSGATKAWSLAVVTGTPAASPSEPSAPANSIVLAMVDVPAASSSVVNARIADRRTYGGRPWAVAWGEVAYAGATTAQGSISAETDITGLSVTWDAVAGRKYEVVVRIPVFDVASAGTAAVLIKDGSGTLYGQGNMTLGSGASTNFTVTSRYVASSSGSVTRKARAIATGGGGTITSTTNVPSFISVKDIGPASVG